MNKPKRRKLTPELQTLFAEWRASSRKYGNGDPFNTIETISLYEGFQDTPADVIVAANILETLPDVDRALTEMKQLAKKSVGFFIQLDALRTKDDWKAIINRFFPVVDVAELPGNHIWIVGAAVNAFGSGFVVAAGTPEGRWANILANCQATPKRIAKASAHERVAILACYGPSLASNLIPLIDESKDGTRDVISVSGSHDFLIDHGIVPHYHVECDPRPHKADNIANGHPEVEYLLGSAVHPQLMDKLINCNVTLWHPSGEFNFKIADTFEPGSVFIGGGGNVGLRAIVLLYTMGYRSFSIYGMDCSFSDDGEQKWAGAHAQKKNPVEQTIIKVRCGTDMREFTTSPIYITYANSFFDTRKLLEDAEFRVMGDSLLGAMCRNWNQYLEETKAA